MVHDSQSEIDYCLYLVLPPIHKGPHLCYSKWFTRYSKLFMVCTNSNCWRFEIIASTQSLPSIFKIPHLYYSRWFTLNFESLVHDSQSETDYCLYQKLASHS